jgi:hypothetical protein
MLDCKLSGYRLYTLLNGMKSWLTRSSVCQTAPPHASSTSPRRWVRRPGLAGGTTLICWRCGASFACHARPLTADTGRQWRDDLRRIRHALLDVVCPQVAVDTRQRRDEHGTSPPIPHAVFAPLTLLNAVGGDARDHHQRRAHPRQPRPGWFGREQAVERARHRRDGLALAGLARRRVNPPRLHLVCCVEARAGRSWSRS